MRLIQILFGAQLYCFIPLRNIVLASTENKLTNKEFSTTTTTTSKMAQESCSVGSTYEPNSTSVAFVTTPDENSAKKIANALITQKLAACVNVIPNLTSIYYWDGKINEDSEYLLMIKTRTNRVEELTKFVRENHPYSVAEVITLPIQNGNPPYLDWILKTVPNKN